MTKRNKQHRQTNDKHYEERKEYIENNPIHPKSANQKLYIDNLKKFKLNIAVGSAGTGKTFLPASMAADEFRLNKIEKILVARPYVQTGRTSGFKKGSTLEKLYPYVRPMLDAIKKRIGDGAYANALKDGVTGNIEVAELEAIRGRSFDEPSWLLLDEMQQSTKDEMIALLTRVGEDCIVTVCGDPKQKDIRGESGLEWLLSFVKRHNIECGIVEFTSDDIVRGSLVKKIVKGLEEDENTYR